MPEQDEINRLKQELYKREQILLHKQQTCLHEWSEVQYDPESYQKAHFSHYEPTYTYSTAYKDRWSRVCKKCGKVEYSYEKKPVKYEPFFK